MAKEHLTDLQCKETIYITPDSILDPVRSYCGGPIPLDPATQPNNPTSALQFAVDPLHGSPPGALIDGLATTWHKHGTTFVNPPYGKVLKTWCEKIHTEAGQGATILALLPAGPRFATRYWQDHIFTKYLKATLFVRGRVKFLRPDGSGTAGQNPYDSQLLLFNGDVAKFGKAFKHLGKVVKMEVL